MKRLPKYIALPAILAIYFVIMAAYGIASNNGHLPDDFLLITIVEALVLVVLFFLLKRQHESRNS